VLGKKKEKGTLEIGTENRKTPKKTSPQNLPLKVVRVHSLKMLQTPPMNEN
jgi:hypothetical protein